MAEILNLEFFAFDRDMHIMTPVNLYLEKKKGVKVTYGNLWIAEFVILMKRPRLIILSNAHGDDSTYHLLKFLHKLNFHVVTLVTEGNFHEEYLRSYIWAWNQDFKLYQNAMVLWNTHSKEITLKHYGYLQDQLFVSGATGFDRYFLINYDSVQLRKKYKISHYKKVVGIASFGGFDTIDKIDYLYSINPEYPRENYELFLEDYPKVKSIYRQLIEDNPDTLFILRVHPQFNTAFQRSEFADCMELENTLISSTVSELADIAEAIALCDIWIGYESTTSMEAWLLNKLVLYINPTRTDFVREDHHKGVLICSNTSELQAYIDAYYSGQKIEEYDKLAAIRKTIIERVIEHADGKNHERAAEIIYSFYKNAKRPSFFKSSIALIKRINLKFLIRFFLHRTGWYFKLRPDLEKPFYAFSDKEVILKYKKLYEKHFEA